MIAFHGDVAIKTRYIARVRAHRRADELVRGAAGRGGRGCAVWCTLDQYDHARYPVELGIPEVLARLEDRLFEGMPARNAMAWPATFLAAIPVGADLSDAWPKFAIWLLKDVRKFARPDGKAAIDSVVGLYRERAPRTDPRWGNARNAAAAAADAADAAAYATYVAVAIASAVASAVAAAYAADAIASAIAAALAANAADAVSSASAYAADAYATSAYAARSGAYYRQSRQLLEILRRCKVTKADVKLADELRSEGRPVS